MGEFDSMAFRAVMGQFATGVVIATGVVNGRPAGFAAQSFVSLSLDPPLVALCPAKNSTSWPKLRASGHFCINVLAANQQPVCDIFAVSGGEKFTDLAWHPGPTGSPILEGVLAYVDCQIEAEHEAGDHLIAVGRVADFAVLEEKRGPLLFFRGGYGEFD